MTNIAELKDIKLKDLKRKTPAELVTLAEELEVENASALRKQELMFAILKNLAVRDIEIIGEGVVEVLQDGFGFLRSSDANYLAGPDDIYVSPSQIRKFTLRTGHVDLVVEVTDVADDCLVLHATHVRHVDDVVATRRCDEDVGSFDDIVQRRDLVAVHCCLERTDGINFSDDDASALPTERFG